MTDKHKTKPRQNTKQNQGNTQKCEQGEIRQTKGKNKNKHKANTRHKAQDNYKTTKEANKRQT